MQHVQPQWMLQHQRHAHNLGQDGCLARPWHQQAQTVASIGPWSPAGPPKQVACAGQNAGALPWGRRPAAPWSREAPHGKSLQQTCLEVGRQELHAKPVQQVSGPEQRLVHSAGSHSASSTLVEGQHPVNAAVAKPSVLDQQHANAVSATLDTGSSFVQKRQSGLVQEPHRAPMLGLDTPRLAQLLRPPATGFLELCGAAGAGKTQVMMDACCRAVLASQSRVIFVDTEGSFDAGRFREILAASTSNSRLIASALERLHVYRTFDALELQMVVGSVLDELHGDKGRVCCSALFVDSIAFPFRGDFRHLNICLGRHSRDAVVSRAVGELGPRGSIDEGIERNAFEMTHVGVSRTLWRRRSCALNDVGNALREISGRGVTVMVSNHLAYSEAAELVPALGDQWTRKASRRLRIQHVAGEDVRHMELVASADDRLPIGVAVGLRIHQAGVQGDDEASGDECSEDDFAADETQGTQNNDTCEHAHSDIGSDGGSESDGADEDPQVGRLVAASACRHCWPPTWWISRPAVAPKTTCQLLSGRQLRSHVALPVVDTLLDGCRASGIVEICGEAGSGKTQICLQSLVAALSSAVSFAEGNKRVGRAPCVAYLYSECAPLSRLRQMWSAHCKSSGVADAANSVQEMLDSTFVQQATTPVELYEALAGKLQYLLRFRSVELLVIDSVAALFAGVDVGLVDRSVQMFRIAALLKRISAEHGVQVLVTNQVRADFDAGRGDWIKPALGEAWSACVSHRISLHRSDGAPMQTKGAAFQSSKCARFARLEFSPVAPQATMGFAIEETGVCPGEYCARAVANAGAG